MSFYHLFFPIKAPINSIQCLSTDPYIDEHVEMRVFLKLLHDSEYKDIVYKNLPKIYEVISFDKLENSSKKLKKLHLTDFHDSPIYFLMRFLKEEDLLNLSKTCRYFYALVLTFFHVKFIENYQGFAPHYINSLTKLLYYTKKSYPASIGDLCKEFLFAISIFFLFL